MNQAVLINHFLLFLMESAAYGVSRRIRVICDIFTTNILLNIALGNSHHRKNQYKSDILINCTGTARTGPIFRNF